MKCCILESPGRITIDDVADPIAGPGDVVIRVQAALTCGTDLKAFRRGHPKMPFPTPFGHEFAGEIVEAGAGVEGFRVGDAVMSANTGPCGACFYCERDQQNLCDSIMDEMILGAYAEYLRIPERVVRSNVYSKPDDLPYEQAALLEPLSSVCFGLSQIPEAFRGAGSTALILGAGPIALLWLVALQASGFERVVVAGRRAPRLEVARSFGAHTTLGEGEDVGARLRELTSGRGADVVVECTGVPQIWEDAPGYARRGGFVVWFGGCAPGTTVELDTFRMHYDGVSVASPFHFRPRDVAASYELLRRCDVNWANFITSRASLDEVPAVFESLGDGRDVKCAILPHPRGATTNEA